LVKKIFSYLKTNKNVVKHLANEDKKNPKIIDYQCFRISSCDPNLRKFELFDCN